MPKIYLESFNLTLSWRRPLSYRNQSIDLLHKSIDWFLYDNGLRHERVKFDQSCITLPLRDIFKTMVNIYDGAFLQKHLTALIC